ncbi:hypothetical protein [Vibrio cionasavignyae]|uniref:hypothetical protein n=1 Tax=Vibrio cionasavignyae TaxID=2910252 RepID=UPI003D10F738
MKLLYSIVAVALLAGCSSTSKVDRFELLATWNSKFEACYDNQKNSTAVFPQTDWFKNLELDDQKNVVIYLNELKMYQCTEKETLAIVSQFSEEDIKIASEILGPKDVFLPPSKDKVASLEQTEIDKIDSELDLFFIRRVGEQLGFVK